MKIACISDMHGYLPDRPTNVDLAIIAGDFVQYDGSYRQAQWLRWVWVNWAENIGCPIVVVAGNHDVVFEQPWLLPKFPDNVYYLQDDMIEINGFTILGSPWTKTFNNWAFMKDEESLERHFQRLLDAYLNQTDIFVFHSPPYGVGDEVDDRHEGSSELNRITYLEDRLYVFGHIHEGRGIYQKGSTTLINAAYVDGDYKPTGNWSVIDIE